MATKKNAVTMAEKWDVEIESVCAHNFLWWVVSAFLALHINSGRQTCFATYVYSAAPFVAVFLGLCAKMVFSCRLGIRLIWSLLLASAAFWSGCAWPLEAWRYWLALVVTGVLGFMMGVGRIVPSERMEYGAWLNRLLMGRAGRRTRREELKTSCRRWGVVTLILAALTGVTVAVIWNLPGSVPDKIVGHGVVLAVLLALAAGLSLFTLASKTKIADILALIQRDDPSNTPNSDARSREDNADAERINGTSRSAPRRGNEQDRAE